MIVEAYRSPFSNLFNLRIRNQVSLWHNHTFSASAMSDKVPPSFDRAVFFSPLLRSDLHRFNVHSSTLLLFFSDLRFMNQPLHIPFPYSTLLIFHNFNHSRLFAFSMKIHLSHSFSIICLICRSIENLIRKFF